PRLVERGREQAVMDVKRLVAVVEAVDRAVGKREMRHAAEEDGGDAMAFEIERCDSGHGLQPTAGLVIERVCSTPLWPVGHRPLKGGDYRIRVILEKRTALRRHS